MYQNVVSRILLYSLFVVFFFFFFSVSHCPNDKIIAIIPQK